VVVIQVRRAAYIEVNNDLTVGANYVGNHQGKGWFLASHNLVRKLFDFEELEHIFEQCLGLRLEGWVEPEDMVTYHLGELKGWD